jgi:leader peptidase (prepilin peptidase)/N-methyltransferase
MTVIFDVFVFLLGAIVGSFLNATVYRVKNKEDFVKSRSKCINCKHVLSPLDLIPILSYIFLRGKCRYCKEKIHLRYLIFELITGLVFLLYFNFLSFNYFVSNSIFVYINIIFYLLVICVFLYIGLYDFFYYEISDRLVLYSSILVFIYFLVAYYSGYISLNIIINHIFTAIIAAGIFLLIILLTKGEGMGGGDMKLVFLMGIVLGYPVILYVLFFAFVIGAVIGLVLVMIKNKTLKSSIPFAPFLSSSLILYIIFSVYILRFISYLFIR